MAEDIISSVEQKETKKKDRKYTVYIHRNKINNHAYIGKTHNINERWRRNGVYYQQQDKNGKYQQPVFAYALKKYTWDGFEHIIFAENLTEQEAGHIEKILIAIFKTNICKYNKPHYGYNMTDGGEGASGRTISEETRKLMGKIAKERLSVPENNPFYGKKHTEESKEKMRVYAKNRPPEFNKMLSDIAKERFSKPENCPMFGKHLSDSAKQIISDTHSIPVIQLTLFGDFVNEYKSSDEVEAILGIDSSSVRRCCTGNQLSAGGFQWVEKEKYNPSNTYVYIDPSLVPVVQLSPDGTFIAEYQSIIDAHKATGVGESDIRRCCASDFRTAGGFIWIYKANYNPNNIITRKPRITKRKIIQCDKDYNYIAEYDGCMHAAKITGHERHGISDCCEGKKEFYCGYRWMYIEDYEELLKQNKFKGE